jgi:putative acetyltransferase
VADGRIALRAMRPEDLEAVLDLWVASWQAAYPAIDFAARRAWMAERLTAADKAGIRVIVAADAARPIGLVTIDPQTGYLDQIAIAPECQRQGVASALLAEAQRLSPEGVSLHVNQDNERAIRFYEKHGFAVAGEDVNARSGAPVFRMVRKP